jgi:hypothetical protein
MNADLQPVSWPWIKAVLGAAFFVVLMSGIVLAPLSKLLAPERLQRLPYRLRWILVIPAAFLMGFAAEVVSRLLFAAGEIVSNHELLFRPGVDSLIWQVWAPLLFVAGGLQLAPSRQVLVFLLLGGIRMVVALVNLAVVLNFVHHGGPWSALDPVTRSPIWWNASMYVLCILLLASLGIFLVNQKRARAMAEAPAVTDSFVPMPPDGPA